MFGLMRYAFALCVLFSHISSRTPVGPAAYAVWGFYTLSGYLMALVLAEKYPFDRSGLRMFAISRALRLLPAYYVACLLMVGVLLAVPTAGDKFIGMHLPTSPVAYLNSAIPILPPVLGDILPQFSAVRIEIFYYAVMALGLARSTRVAIVWWAGAAAFASWQMATHASFDSRYLTLAGTSVAFATGVLIYRLRAYLPAWRSPWAIAAAGLAWFAHIAFIRMIVPTEALDLGLYTSLGASALAIILLRGLDPKSVPGWLARLDRVAGDLSYPIYLTHWSVAVVVLALIGKGRHSGTQALLTFFLCSLVSWIIFRWVETPGDRLRRRISSRRKARTVPAPTAIETMLVDA
jgi:peptidoglycan/LPS O-acetylase OafA/YrhL